MNSDQTTGIASELDQVTDHHDVFLSYSRNDLEAATNLLGQLDRHGLSVFRDQESIRAGDLWLDRLQAAVHACDSFVVLVGRDGVRRWVGAETQVALSRHFGPHDEAARLPIFPILLGDTDPAALPAFLRLFQGTAWDGAGALPEGLLEQIRERTIVAGEIPFEGCPFVGLDAYRPDQARLFFGRQKETLDALACFDPKPGNPDRPRADPVVRWLEINGNSGSGKSSLMNAGLLPLVDQGWLWPRTGYERWLRIGPLMPGERPVMMLAEHLARAFKKKMAEVRRDLDGDDKRALADWLRGEKPDERTAFLLAIDQFEELFTFADPGERGRFDRMVAAALDDPDCPLFVISTVRSDFLDRFEALPQLVAVRNRLGKAWTLPLVSTQGLREIISGPAQLAGIDPIEVQEVMIAEAEGEPGALPLVQNALQWLWERRTDGRLSGTLLNDQGGLAGILSKGADDLLQGLGKRRDRALELLFRLVKVDPEGRRHTRQRMPLPEAVAVAGGDAQGRALVDHLAGTRARDDPRAKGPLRLITVSEGGKDETTSQNPEGWVNLIHETLIRSKGLDSDGKPQPYWPTLWRYIEQHKDRAARRERLQLQAREWKERRGLARLFGLAGWSSVFRYRGLAAAGSVEQRYLRWSRATALTVVAVVALMVGVGGESVYWMVKHQFSPTSLGARWAYWFGQELPLPELERIPPDDVQDPPPADVAQPLYFGRTEVTFREWDACVEAGGCNNYHPRDQWGREQLPVINVNSDDAQAYARWLGAMTGTTCRLPSEAEWEYACRADTTTPFALPAPDGSDDIRGLANCSGCGGEWDDRNQTSPVGSFPANAWNLYDMHGNVFEWTCVDTVEDSDAIAGDCQTRVLRGGSWSDAQVDARCADRSRGGPFARLFGIGFRVVCSSPILDR